MATLHDLCTSPEDVTVGVLLDLAIGLRRTSRRDGFLGKRKRDLARRLDRVAVKRLAGR